MRGFLTGSLALIVLYVLTQEETANKIGLGSNVLTEMLTHALSPSYPGIPNKSRLRKIPSAQSGGTTQPGATTVDVSYTGSTQPIGSGFGQLEALTTV